MRQREIGFIYPKIWTVGLDLGQAQDPSAIVAVESTSKVQVRHDEMADWSKEPRRKFESVLHAVRHAERLPLGMSYIDQAAYVRRFMSDPALPRKDTELVLDRTGVGAAVADLFRSEGLDPIQVVITGGSEEQRDGARVYKVPKLLLVSRLQASLHAGELKFAMGLPEEQAFKEELASFRMKYTDAGGLTFNARSGRHDDLVLALAIALWHAQERARGGGFTIGLLLGV